MTSSGEQTLSLIDDLPQPAFVLDHRGYFTQVNTLWSGLVGYPAEEVEGRFALSDLCDATIEAICGMPATEGAVPPRMVRWRHRDGSNVETRVRCRRLSAASSPEMAAVGTVEPLEGESLLGEDGLLGTVLEGLGEGVFVIDRNFRIVEASAEACRVHGRSRGQMEGLHCYELTHGFQKPCWLVGGHHHRCPVKEAMDQGTMSRSVHVHNDGRGGIRYVEVIAFPVKGGGGDVSRVIEVVRDITDQKTMEERLHRVERLETVATLAGGIAHDLNNILTPILGNTELAMMEVDPDHPVQDRLKAIFSASKRAARLVEHVLSFSRQQRLERGVIPLAASVEGLRPLIRGLLPSSGEIELSMRPCEAGVEVVADLGQLEEIVINLIVNARDAIEAAGGSGRIILACGTTTLRGESCFTCGAAMEGEMAFIRVADDGQGMEASVLEKAFEPFFTTKPVGKGSGLGLSTVTGIVHGHGGHISVDTHPGRGTLVSVYLPLAPKEAGDEEPIEEARLG